MQKNKIEIIRKELKNTCWTCEGLRGIYNKKRDIIDVCSTCNGTGIWVETFFYHIVNGICFGGDTLK